METLVYDRKKALGPLDKVLLQGAAAGKSPTELSVLVNGMMKPAECAARVNTLLESRDWLSQAQERMLLLDDMQALKDQLMEQAITFKSLEAARPLVSLLREIGVRIDADKGTTELDLNTLYANQGKIMGRVVDQALSYMKGALREKVDPELWDDLVREALLNAQTEISKYEAVEA